MKEIKKNETKAEEIVMQMTQFLEKNIGRIIENFFMELRKNNIQFFLRFKRVFALFVKNLKKMERIYTLTIIMLQKRFEDFCVKNAIVPLVLSEKVSMFSNQLSFT